MTRTYPHPAPTNAELALLLHDIVQLARTAGAAIMQVYRSEDFGASSKADNSPLTLADLAAHQCIVAGLSGLACGYPVLSEEDASIPYAVRSKWTHFWLVDPLDGTKEFIKRNGEFTVNIALVADGVPVLGVVYAPALELCYYAARGNGAFVQRGEQAAQPVKAVAHTAGAAINMVASRSHSDTRTAALLNKLGEHECTSVGSSLKTVPRRRSGGAFISAAGADHGMGYCGGTCRGDGGGWPGVRYTRQPLRYNKDDLHNPEFLVLAKTDVAMLGMLRDALETKS